MMGGGAKSNCEEVWIQGGMENVLGGGVIFPLHSEFENPRGKEWSTPL